MNIRRRKKLAIIGAVAFGIICIAENAALADPSGGASRLLHKPAEKIVPEVQKLRKLVMEAREALPTATG